MNDLVPIDKLKATAEPVTVVTILNPFRPYDRTILRKDWQPGKGIDYYTGYLPVLADVELVASVNGKVVRDWSQVDVNPGDFIAVCPLVAGGGGGKKILRLVGMLAVAFIAHWAAGALAPTFAGVLGGLETAKWIIGGVIGLVGAMIVNAIAPPPKPDIPRIGQDSWNESPTYSWNVLRNLNTQGNPIPILYGTMRVAGQIISKVVDVDGDKQYLNVLIAVAGHEVDSLTDIEINGQPESYYYGVTSYTRLGTNSDAVIPGFNEVATQQTFGTKLNYGSPVTYETDGNAVEKIKLHITAPYGCYYANDQGGLDSRSASFRVQYRVKGTSTWTTQGNYTISGATTKRLSRTVTFDTPSADQYEVRVQRTNSESSSARERTAIYWTAMTEIIKRSLIYPGIAKYAVRALATDQLSGAEPTFTVKATRSTVQVYNPSTSSWESRSASNPAWAAYDLLVNETYGGRIDHTRIDYDAFEAWASYCDETVQGETRFKLNIYIDSQMTLWEALLTICKAGRAVPVRKGTQYSVIVDKPSTPVQMFTMADIKAGTFKETFLQKKDRANAIEVTYIDEDRGYTRQTVAVYSDDYNNADEPDNKQSMRLVGCTRRTQAIREAAFHLNSTKWLVRTCEFEVDIQALACQVGDRIYIQHDVPKYGHGGRVVEATSTTVTVDHDVVPTLGATNVIAVLHNDDSIEEKTVTQLDYKDNLVVNGNFERDSVGSTAPDGWTVSYNTTPTKHEVYATSQDESGGDSPWWREDAHTFWFNSSPVEDLAIRTTDFITVDETKRHNINFWWMRKSGTVEIDCRVYCYDSLDSLIGTLSPISVTSSSGSDWSQENVVIYASSETSESMRFPSGTAKVKVVFPLQTNSNSGEGLITRIQLVENEEPVDWLSKLTVSSAWSSTPEQYERYAFGEQDSYRKPYTVVNISRGADLDKKLTCVEYIEDIYTDTGYVFEVPTWDVDYQEATKVYLHEFLSFSPDGTYASNLAVTWHPSISTEHYSWHIWLEDLTSGDDPVFVGQADTMHFVIGPQYLTLNHQYKVYVVQLGQGPVDLGGNTATITIQGEYAPPSDVTSFSGTFDSVTRNVKFTWTAIDDIDLDHYEIRQGGTDWDSATVIIEHAIGTTASWYVEDTTNDTIRFWIKAVDKAGVYSENAAYDDVDIDTSSCPLQQPTGLTLSTFSEIADDGTDHVFVRAEWNNNAESSDDFHHYDVRLVKEPSGSGYTSHYSTFETNYLWEVKPNTEYGAYVRAVDRGGNATNWTSMVTTTSAKDSTPPATPSWQTTPIIPGFKVMGLHWQANTEDDLLGYEIQRSMTGNWSGEEESLGYAYVNFFTDSGLDVSTTYYYRIRAVDTSGNTSGWSTTESGTTLQVGAADIAYNTITANHVDTWDLTALTAKVTGTLSAGKLESNNWGTDEGVQIDLDNEVVRFGGSDDPKLSWNGTILEVEGEITVTGGSGASNFSDFTLPLANLVQNPGFEDSTKPDWWTEKGSAVSIETTGGNDSNHWMKVTRSGSDAPSRAAESIDSTTRRYIEVNPGDVYEFGADIKTDGTCVGGVGIGVYDKDKGDITWVLESSTSTSWENKTHRYTVPSGKRYISLFVGAYTNDGWAGFDNVFLRKIDSLSAGWGHSSDITKIDGGNIYTGTITATQLIQTAAVITQSAQIGTGIITTAKIDDAAITNAKIDDLAVNTIKVADGSISRAESSYGSGSVHINYYNTDITVISKSITVMKNKKVFVQVSYEFYNDDIPSNKITVKLFRGSTLLVSYHCECITEGATYSFSYSDTPKTSGGTYDESTYTYYLKVNNQTLTDFYVRKRSMLLMTTKR